MKRLLSTLACGLALACLAAPAAASDLDKFIPENSNFYVHINIKQMCGTSMLRKVLPKVLDKHGEGLIKMAAQANPQAGMLEAMWPQLQEALRDQEKVDQFFDAAADAVTDVVMAGVVKDGDSDDMPPFVMLIASKHMTTQNVQMFSGLIGAQMPGMLKEEKLAGKDVWLMSPPGSPVSFYIAIIEDGVMAFSPDKAVMESALKGGKTPKFAPEVAPLMKNRTDKCSIFFAGYNAKDSEKAFGQIMIAKDLDVNVVREFKDSETAKKEADQMNEEFAGALAGGEAMLGDAATKLKGMLENLRKVKAVADGSKVTLKLNVSTDELMKLLKD